MYNLYIVSNTNTEDFCEDTISVGVWHSTPYEALESVKHEVFEGEEEEFLDSLEVAEVQIALTESPLEPDFCDEKTLSEALRTLGYFEEEEVPCAGCELYALGIKEHKVCATCGLCPTCAKLTIARCECF